MKLSYTEQANNLAAAIDIAIKTLQTIPPHNFNEQILSHTITTYEEWKNSALNPAPEFKNTQSQKYITNDVFTFFQEASGKTVDLFWQLIKESNLPYNRENKLVKVLKRQKIKNNQEYSFIIDVIIPYKQEGLINDEEAYLLNKLLADFEQSKSKK